MAAIASQPSRKQKIRHELAQTLILSIYLYACFGAINLYAIAVLQENHVDYNRFGLAVIKALIIAKFVMIGRALHLGERHRDKPLIHYIAYQVAMFTALVIVLSIGEEIVVALIHGRTIADALYKFSGGTWLKVVAQCAILCLVLIPYLGITAIDDTLGEDRLRRMFFGERSN